MDDPERIISFSRHVVSNPPDWNTNQSVLDCSIVNVHMGGMEASRSRGFVDFANKDLHVGTILASLTQEEECKRRLRLLIYHRFCSVVAQNATLDYFLLSNSGQMKS